MRGLLCGNGRRRTQAERGPVVVPGVCEWWMVPWRWGVLDAPCPCRGRRPHSVDLVGSQARTTAWPPPPTTLHRIAAPPCNATLGKNQLRLPPFRAPLVRQLAAGHRSRGCSTPATRAQSERRQNKSPVICVSTVDGKAVARGWAEWGGGGGRQTGGQLQRVVAGEAWREGIVSLQFLALPSNGLGEAAARGTDEALPNGPAPQTARLVIGFSFL